MDEREALEPLDRAHARPQRAAAADAARDAERGRSTAWPVSADWRAAWVISIAARPSSPVILGGRPARRSSTNPLTWRPVLPIRRGSRGLKSGSVHEGSCQIRSVAVAGPELDAVEVPEDRALGADDRVLVVASRPEARLADLVRQQDLAMAPLAIRIWTSDVGQRASIGRR